MAQDEDIYRYSVDQCDVVDKVALLAFREKRRVWLSWLNSDDVHAIWPQISSALWNDVAFRTISEIALADAESALNNPVLTEALVHGYYSAQALSIRRLFDQRSDVISLRRLLDDIEQNLALFTRENYVAHDGLPYDYEEIERQKMIEIMSAGGGHFWAEQHGPKAYIPAQARHKTLTVYAGVPVTHGVEEIAFC